MYGTMKTVQWKKSYRVSCLIFSVCFVRAYLTLVMIGYQTLNFIWEPKKFFLQWPIFLSKFILLATQFYQILVLFVITLPTVLIILIFRVYSISLVSWWYRLSSNLRQFRSWLILLKSWCSCNANLQSYGRFLICRKMKMYASFAK